jgi:hypothetical protein
MTREYNSEGALLLLVDVTAAALLEVVGLAVVGISAQEIGYLDRKHAVA